ncbi:MAG: DMT family transporter [Hyphomicrobiales bacterium]|nr:DMT family transporter [Hyphomicrobiales bacterium]
MSQPPRPPETAAGGLESQTLAGVGLALLGAFLFATVFILPKVEGTGLDTFQVAFFRFLFGFLSALPVALVARRRGRLRSTGAARWHALRAVFAVTSLVCTVFAVRHMPVSEAVTLANSKALFVVLLAALFLGERLTGYRLWCVALAMAGALVIMRPSPQFLESVMANPASLLALTAALSVAIESVMMRRLADRDGAVVAVLWLNGAATLLLLPLAVATWQAPTLSEWLILGAMGPLAVAGNVANLQAYRRLEAVRVTPLSYSAIAFSALLGWLLLGEVPTVHMAVGAVMIAAAGWLVARERKPPFAGGQRTWRRARSER